MQGSLLYNFAPELYYICIMRWLSPHSVLPVADYLLVRMVHACLALVLGLTSTIAHTQNQQLPSGTFNCFSLYMRTN